MKPSIPARRLVLAALVAASVAACGDERLPATQPGAPPKQPAPTQEPASAPSPAPAENGAGGAAVGADRQAVLTSYDRGLDWLLGLQKDGTWEGEPGKPNPALTALAAAALYERPGGVREKDAETARKAIDYLVTQVEPDGTVMGTATGNYTTSVLVMALVASERPDVKPVIDRCAAKLRTYQFLEKDNTTYGGIGYGSDKTRSDLSNTQYALASLRAAGVSEDDPAMVAAREFLARTQNRKENETPGEPSEWRSKDEQGVERVYVRANDGGANYRPGDSKAGFDERPDGVRVLRSYGSMTYALLRCYHLAGLPASDERVKAAADWIRRNWTLERNPGMPEKSAGDGLLYMYATIGKTLPLAGIDTIEHEGRSIDWRRELADHLAKTQRPDGSWMNEASSRWEEGNPVVGTAFALTALSACVR